MVCPNPCTVLGTLKSRAALPRPSWLQGNAAEHTQLTNDRVLLTAVYKQNGTDFSSAENNSGINFATKNIW